VSAIDELTRQRVVPVLRCADADDAVETARALAAGGFHAVELTMSTPGVLAAIPPLAADGLVVGVGTIRSAGEVEAAVAAGARFVVSFWNPPGFVGAAAALGVPAIPGGLTPGEIAAAQLEGPAAVKLFPATLVTPGYVRTLLLLDPSLRLFVTGGIEPTTASIAPWLEAGAELVGIGGALGTARTVGAAEVERRARQALATDRS
jgi:2-dehydro-3-deoxyphosphogluconate aldolase/(4S)-4-hydroxy-2-oxoglutarate aldolase